MKKRLRFGLLILLAMLFLTPVFYTFVRSLTYGENRLTLMQYIELLTTNYTVMKYFWNSALYACVITFSCLILSFPLGFLFAKVKFRGREALFFVYIVVMLLPFQATQLSNYLQLRELSLLNTKCALILPMMFSPLAVFLYRQFMISIPDEQLEYASLETKSVWKILRYVVLPQTKSAVIALGILIFCESWNMVEQAVIFLPKSEAEWPLSVVLTDVPDDVRFSGAVVYMYPIMILFLCFRKTFAKSMEKFRW